MKKHAKKKKNDNTPLPAPDLERPSGNEQMEEDESPAPDTRACISVHSVRKRLADPDGISAKAAIDGLVKAGILADDSTLYIKEVSYTQTKTTGSEYTIIEIEYEQ